MSPDLGESADNYRGIIDVVVFENARHFEIKDYIHHKSLLQTVRRPMIRGK